MARFVIVIKVMGALEKRDVLIVDDDVSIRNLLGHALRRAGILCTLAADGLEAAHRIHEAEYAIVLLDLMMPRVDGFGFLEYLREWEESYGARPVVLLMTAAAEEKEFTAAGDVVQAVIPKPSDIGEVAEICQQCVAVRREYESAIATI